MNGNSHFVFGAAAASSAAILIGADQNTTTLLLSTALIGSIFPDIDNPQSHFGKLTKPVSTWISRFQKCAGKTGRNHRWIFHDLGLYIMAAAISLPFIPALFGFYLGLLSHFILDSLNPAGVRLFGKYICFSKIPSDSKLARGVTWILTVAIIGASIGWVAVNGPVDVAAVERLLSHTKASF